MSLIRRITAFLLISVFAFDPLWGLDWAVSPAPLGRENFQRQALINAATLMTDSFSTESAVQVRTYGLIQERNRPYQPVQNSLEAVQLIVAHALQSLAERTGEWDPIHSLRDIKMEIARLAPIQKKSGNRKAILSDVLSSILPALRLNVQAEIPRAISTGRLNGWYSPRDRFGPVSGLVISQTEFERAWSMIRAGAELSIFKNSFYRRWLAGLETLVFRTGPMYGAILISVAVLQQKIDLPNTLGVIVVASGMAWWVSHTLFDLLHRTPPGVVPVLYRRAIQYAIRQLDKVQIPVFLVGYALLRWKLGSDGWIPFLGASLIPVAVHYLNDWMVQFEQKYPDQFLPAYLYGPGNLLLLFGSDLGLTELAMVRSSDVQADHSGEGWAPTGEVSQWRKDMAVLRNRWPREPFIARFGVSAVTLKKYMELGPIKKSVFLTFRRIASEMMGEESPKEVKLDADTVLRERLRVLLEDADVYEAFKLKFGRPYIEGVLARSGTLSKRRSDLEELASHIEKHGSKKTLQEMKNNLPRKAA